MIRFLMLLLALSFVAHAAVWESDGSTSDTQAEIDNASSGDTVRFPLNGGPFGWTTGVTISNKWITLDLNGSTITRSSGTANFIVVYCHADGTTRITNGSMEQSGDHASNVAWLVEFYAATVGTTELFRLDHMNLTGSGSSTLIRITRAWGLIDNCYIRANGNSETIHNWGGSAVETADGGWASDVTAGSEEAVYLEDNLFERYDLTAALFGGTCSIQNYYGARMVYRYNTNNYMAVDVHGNTHPCGRWWEIYENTFLEPATGNQSDAMQIRGGSGVIYNNTLVEDGGGAMSIGLIEDTAPGTCPLVYQIGRGKNTTTPPATGSDQASDPAYVWGNSKGPGTGGAGASCIILNDSYFTSAKPSYTPYTYPHPLRVDGGGEAAGSGKGRGQLGTAGRFRMR